MVVWIPIPAEIKYMSMTKGLNNFQHNMLTQKVGVDHIDRGLKAIGSYLEARTNLMIDYCPT